MVSLTMMVWMTIDLISPPLRPSRGSVMLARLGSPLNPVYVRSLVVIELLLINLGV